MKQRRRARLVAADLRLMRQFMLQSHLTLCPIVAVFLASSRIQETTAQGCTAENAGRAWLARTSKRPRCCVPQLADPFAAENL
jgi:hypothetical protein